jgi:hypothetical protein
MRIRGQRRPLKHAALHQFETPESGFVYRRADAFLLNGLLDTYDRNFSPKDQSALVKDNAISKFIGILSVELNFLGFY